MTYGKPVMPCRLDEPCSCERPPRLAEGGVGSGPDGGGAGRIGRVVVVPKLPPAREWVDIADALEVRGGKLGRVWYGS